MFLLPLNYGFGEDPEYAKWGNIAVKQTQEKFPDYDLTDYLYEGKVVVSEARHQYNFKLILKKSRETKEIRVFVLVNPKQDQLIDVFFDE